MKRARGFIGELANAVEQAMRVREALDALKGSGGLELSGEYDGGTGLLVLELVVTHGIEKEIKGEVADLEVSFELGQRIFELPIAIDPPH